MNMSTGNYGMVYTPYYGNPYGSMYGNMYGGSQNVYCPPTYPPTYPPNPPTNTLPAFNLTPTDVARLFDASDGLGPNTNPDWENYPNRAVNEWGVGFTNKFNFISGITYIKDPGDNFLSFEEKSLAATQLAWDRTQGAQYNDTAVNNDPISADRAQNAENFLNSLFWNDDSTAPAGKAGQLRDGLDSDGDGKLSLSELLKIAKLDGNPNLTETDLQLAYQSGPTPVVDPPALPLPPQNGGYFQNPYIQQQFLWLYQHYFGSLNGLPPNMTGGGNTNSGTSNGSGTFA